jgi:acyl carrier protein phosphodiesterase
VFPYTYCLPSKYDCWSESQNMIAIVNHKIWLLAWITKYDCWSESQNMIAGVNYKIWLLEWITKFDCWSKSQNIFAEVNHKIWLLEWITKYDCWSESQNTIAGVNHRESRVGALNVLEQSLNCSIFLLSENFKARSIFVLGWHIKFTWRLCSNTCFSK